MTADPTYTDGFYVSQNADRAVVASGGSLDVESGGEIDIESGGALKIAGTAITALAADLNMLGSDKITQAKTVSTAALGTVRGIYGKVTASHAAIASGLVTGVRGEITLSGDNTAGGAYFYGAQGKLIVSGTMNHADSRLCGLMAQLDISAGTYTAGQISALWVDAGGSSVAGALGGQFNMVRITNTTQSVPNAVIYVYSEGSYLFDLGGPSGNADWFDAGTGATANCSGHIKVNLNGTAAYLRVYQSTS